ncbi:zinc-dependent metalloprotease [Luteirhabdus pelagi]|uniref:zinc-dependent metalloprotease n=1 Tax=Luteirhabdus pelagi TaxID=2792783 RepID=UPI001939D928|nr:zinc-dependent metalloprotease [Luteirhabdus pelagi]
MLLSKGSLNYEQVLFTVNDSLLYIEETNKINDEGSPKLLAYLPIHFGNNDFYSIGLKSFIKKTGFLKSHSLKTFSISNIHCKGNELIVEVSGIESGEQGEFSSVHYLNISLMPSPMPVRPFNYRMGFSSENVYSAINHFPKEATGRTARWRLQKKHPDKELSEPIKPITFYLDKEIPKKYIPYVKKGLLEWEKPFEAAGFTNAIQVKELEKDDPFLRNSINTSLVQWQIEDYEKGKEPRSGSTAHIIVDHRTGEIIKSDIVLKSSFQALWEEYFMRCAILDPRAQNFPWSDSLMGELIQSLVAHEVGHALGLRDGHYGEYAYPFTEMRNTQWLEKMGHTPSIMTYSRHHYLPQPSDSIPVSLLMQKVGPADSFMIEWGYRELDQDLSQEGETKCYNEMDSIQNSTPWFHFNIGQFETKGPQYYNEVTDNKDPIASAALGFQNIERTLALIQQLIRIRKIPKDIGERLYSRTIDFWYKQLGYVSTLIGGYTVYYGKDGTSSISYTPIPIAKQQKALQYLAKELRRDKDWILQSPGYYSSAQDQVLANQIEVIDDLFKPMRITRMEGMEQRLNEFFIESMYLNFQKEMWDKIDTENERVLLRWQKLQYQYIKKLKEILKADGFSPSIPTQIITTGYSDYFKGIVSRLLSDLVEKIQQDLDRKMSSTKRTHLEWCLHLLSK